MNTEKMIKVLSDQLCKNCIHFGNADSYPYGYCEGWRKITGRRRSAPKDGIGCVFFVNRR